MVRPSKLPSFEVLKFGEQPVSLAAAARYWVELLKAARMAGLPCCPNLPVCEIGLCFRRAATAVACFENTAGILL
ncbi:hypothetical protein PMI09_00156 [Rhizobium sp. CF122]|nr:hypothetical protein PMI09_00156 [Rhizobium sp. CF122]